MGYWSIAALFVSITFLAYRHHPDLRRHAPQWLNLGSSQVEHPNEPPPKSFSDQTAEDARTSNPSIPKFDLREENDRDDNGQSTPKATAADARSDVPNFSLSTGDDVDDEIEPSAPSFPAPNSAQRAKPMAPPARPSPATSTPTTATGRVAATLKPASTPSSASSLMPPPPRPAQMSKPRPSASTAAGLRVPSTGPLPNRGPPAGSQQRVSGGLAPNSTATSTPNPRGKVLLSPGHSPMDWAALIRRGNISGVDRPQRVTPSLLKQMTGRKGKPAWSSWQGRVYNITPYLPFHPGGEAELMKAAGRDGGKLFLEVHPWVNWENMLDSCMVGVMVPEGTSPLEDMD